MSKSIFVGDSDFSFDSSEVIVADNDSFAREVVWGGNDLEFLPSDSWVLVESAVRKVNNRREFLDIEDGRLIKLSDVVQQGIITIKKSHHIVFGKLSEVLCLGKFDGIESDIVILIEETSDVVQDFLGTGFVW